MSSYHRDIDKKFYPDIGMRGLVVREKLHAFSPDPRDAAQLLPGGLVGQDTTEALTGMLA